MAQQYTDSPTIFNNNSKISCLDHKCDDFTFDETAMIFAPILIILILLGIIGNIFIITTILRIKRLRTLPNYLSINLAISDLVTAVFVNSILLHNILTKTHLRVNTIACDITGYASSITPITSLTILCTIAFQRYCSSSQNKTLNSINRSKAKMAFDIMFPWISATILDVILNNLMNDGHIWDSKIHMCIYVHTDWRVSLVHYVLLVACTLLIFVSQWQLSRATYRWPSVPTADRSLQEEGDRHCYNRNFYISVAGRTVSLRKYQAFKVKASLRRNIILTLTFILTCFPWYTLALINSLWPLGDRAPVVVWMTTAVLEHANSSLNFFINSASSQRYRKLLAKHMTLPSGLAQRMSRTTTGPRTLTSNASRLKGILPRQASGHRSSIDVTAFYASSGILQTHAKIKRTPSLPINGQLETHVEEEDDERSEEGRIVKFDLIEL